MCQVTLTGISTLTACKLWLHRVWHELITAAKLGNIEFHTHITANTKPSIALEIKGNRCLQCRLFSAFRGKHRQSYILNMRYFQYSLYTHMPTYKKLSRTHQLHRIFIKGFGEIGLRAVPF